SALAAACSNPSPTPSAANGEGKLPVHPAWKFVFVNHATTNPFFTPTKYGIEDACALLGCAYQWTGSEINKVSEMVDAMRTAIADKVDGIAVSLVDPVAFNTLTDAALRAGIGVLSYNGDVPPGSPNKRLAYIGQDLYQSGLQVGAHILSLVREGDVVGFIATPGSLNLQPRIDGIHDAIKNSGKPINFIEIATGVAVSDELAAIESYYLAHPKIKGMFAVDGGSTQSIGQVIEKYHLATQGMHGGGYDLTPITLAQINRGNLDFTIDQQPYLQGFLSVVQLFLYKLSGGLQQPSSTNTGLHFVTRENVSLYLKTQTRFEGSSGKELIVAR
ncbi:MAG: sugar ABC transporter substrate-binding protein, partial [Ktedonobacteraceae bacterium]|nr:sugar ABC transporter substrate-binding protein [Ktedonobacteraceae bacterium]